MSEDNLRCSICSDILNELDENNPIITIKCGHIYHYSCIKTSYFYSKNMNCPYCRKDGGKLTLRCKAIIKTGKNKGQICNCSIINNNIYCGRHNKIKKD